MDNVAVLHASANEPGAAPQHEVAVLLKALGDWGVAEERAVPPASLEAYFLRARAAYLVVAGDDSAPRAA